MSDLIHHPEEAAIVYSPERPVEVTTTDGRQMYMTMSDLLDDQFDSMNVTVISVSPDEDHAQFVENPNRGDGDE